MSKESRIEALEEKFEYPFLELSETSFQRFVELNSSCNCSKKLVALLDYLGLEVVSQSDYHVKKKSAPPKEKK
jgi:hypothetical protein